MEIHLEDCCSSAEAAWDWERGERRSMQHWALGKDRRKTAGSIERGICEVNIQCLVCMVESWNRFMNFNSASVIDYL